MDDPGKEIGFDKEILLKIIEKDTLKELKQKAQIAAASFRYSEIAQKAIGM